MTLSLKKAAQEDAGGSFLAHVNIKADHSLETDRDNIHEISRFGTSNRSGLVHLQGRWKKTRWTHENTFHAPRLDRPSLPPGSSANSKTVQRAEPDLTPRGAGASRSSPRGWRDGGLQLRALRGAGAEALCHAWGDKELHRGETQ